MNDIQDEFDNAYTKVENCKDAFAVDLYTLAAKEVEMAGLYRTVSWFKEMIPSLYHQ